MRREGENDGREFEGTKWRDIYGDWFWLGHVAVVVEKKIWIAKVREFGNVCSSRARLFSG